MASLITDADLAAGKVIPDPFLPLVSATVAKMVARAAVETGVARVPGEVS